MYNFQRLRQQLLQRGAYQLLDGPLAERLALPRLIDQVGCVTLVDLGPRQQAAAVSASSDLLGSDGDSLPAGLSAGDVFQNTAAVGVDVMALWVVVAEVQHRPVEAG
jgi:hypothetical protein